MDFDEDRFVLIDDDNSVYEIDNECMRKKANGDVECTEKCSGSCLDQEKTDEQPIDTGPDQNRPFNQNTSHMGDFHVGTEDNESQKNAGTSVDGSNGKNAPTNGNATNNENASNNPNYSNGGNFGRRNRGRCQGGNYGRMNRNFRFPR